MEDILLRSRSILSLTLITLCLAGCGSLFGERRKSPPPIEYAIYTPYAGMHTLAIAPAINLSGSRDFDPLVVSDTLYAEMQQVQNLNVLPLNKTLLAMQRLGIRSLEDVKTVQKLAAYLGADGLVVPAVTAYDPYNPPTVGMILQLYTPAAEQAAPLRVSIMNTQTIRSNPDTVVLATDIPAAPASAAPSRQPASQVAAVYNASNQSVLKELQAFAGGRTQYDSALAEEKFLMDADSYMRFVCHAMVRRLMDVERERVSDR